MRKTLIVIKPVRIKRIPAKQWLLLVGILSLSLLLFFGAAFSFPHLTADSIHELTGPISNIRFHRDWGRHSTATASFEIDGEHCRIALKDRELSLLLRSEGIDDASKTVHVLVTDQGQIAELEYDGTRYRTLEDENLDRSGKRMIFSLFAVLFLLLDILLLSGDLLGYGVIIFRTRPKSMKKSILIEQ